MVFRKGNGVMKRDGKTSSSRIMPFVGPQWEAHLRKLEGYDGRPGYLTRGKRAEGKGRQCGRRTRGQVFLGTEIFSNELFFKSFQGGSSTSFQPPFGI